MPLTPISLAIVDAHVLFRKILRSFISEQKDMNVPIQTSDISDLLDKLKSSSIDILLMDVFFPELNSIDAVKIIRDEYPGLKILVLSMTADMDMISTILDTGIYGFLSKTDEPEELLQAIKTVAGNRIHRNRIFTEALYWNKQNVIKNHTEKTSIQLNEREKKMLQLIWEEKSNKEIARELFLGIRSVEKIRQDMKEKVGVKSTVGLLKYAIDQKIIKVRNSSLSLMQ